MWDQLDFLSQVDRPLTVSEVTGRIRVLIESESRFQDLWIEGEASNVRRAASGHVYFTLKDPGAQLGAVIWRGQARFLTYLPQTGDLVLAHGRIGVYEQGGRYQFYVDFVQPAGRGSLFETFERLKAKLHAEGIFDEGRKRPVPTHPRTIGVVTSPDAAALRDVLRVLQRRYPLARVLLSPTLVQGEEAPSQIVAALERLNQRDDVDVILLVRGGGSLEDLWAFNDERVARAVANSRLPVISGVGHETDFTLADFAADRRAPTPSAAAEIATPNVADLRVSLLSLQGRLVQAAAHRLRTLHERLERSCTSLRHLSPLSRVASARLRVDDLSARLDALTAYRIELANQRLSGLIARLEALDTSSVLKRGYALVLDRASGHVVTAAHATSSGQRLALRFYDGDVPVRVEDAPTSQVD